MVRHFFENLLTLVTTKDLHFEQWMLKLFFFLHSELNEKIVMSQLEGYTYLERYDWVCRLKRSLYGLKQLPRQWYLRFDSMQTYVSNRVLESTVKK